MTTCLSWDRRPWNRETEDTVHKAETFVISPSNCVLKCTKLAIICDPWLEAGGWHWPWRGSKDREAKVKAVERKT